jgi:hypothetical protein
MPDRPSFVGQVITSVSASIIAAAVLWMAMSVSGLRENSAVTSTQITQIQADVGDIKSRLGETLLKSDAQREFQRIDVTLADQDQRLRRLEVK